MFWRFLSKLPYVFKSTKRGYSIKGFWGETKHYNKYHQQTGYSVKGFWGGRKRYDMNGNLKSYTLKSFWGGYDTYDKDGNLIRRSRKNFGGGYNAYNREGKKVMETYKAFGGGLNHFDVGNTSEDEIITPKDVGSPQKIKELNTMRDIDQYFAMQSPKNVTDDEIEF